MLRVCVCVLKQLHLNRHRKNKWHKYIGEDLSRKFIRSTKKLWSLLMEMKCNRQWRRMPVESNCGNWVCESASIYLPTLISLVKHMTQAKQFEQDTFKPPFVMGKVGLNPSRQTFLVGNLCEYIFVEARGNVAHNCRSPLSGARRSFIIY